MDYDEETLLALIAKHDEHEDYYREKLGALRAMAPMKTAVENLLAAHVSGTVAAAYVDVHQLAGEIVDGLADWINRRDRGALYLGIADALESLAREVDDDDASADIFARADNFRVDALRVSGEGDRPSPLEEILAGIRTHNGTPVTAENLRYVASHQSLAGAWIFDVAVGLAEALEKGRA